MKDHGARAHGHARIIGEWEGNQPIGFPEISRLTYGRWTDGGKLKEKERLAAD